MTFYYLELRCKKLVNMKHCQAKIIIKSIDRRKA